MPVLDELPEFDAHAPIVIVGAGACGCTAALAAAERGVAPIVLERDAVPHGNTSLSGGQIPAAGTTLQQAAGIVDSAEVLARDLIGKAKGQCDVGLARHIARESARTVEWLVERHQVPLSCMTGFLYPGHSRPHMHSPPGQDGADLHASLLRAAARADVDLACSAPVTDLYADRHGRILGVRVTRGSGDIETLGCDALILACNGFGGNRALLARHIPEIAQAPYLGHPGNQGDAILWGTALGASIKDLGAFQGHGGVCTPHMTRLGWPVISEGGIQVNADGRRFSNENAGYSEQALNIRRQPGAVAWAIWDDRCELPASGMHYHQDCWSVGAIERCDDVPELAACIGCDARVLGRTLAETRDVAHGAPCPFARDFGAKPALVPPYLCAKVTGALFHTQGGLEVDHRARVLRTDHRPFPNLFAGGGAARGLSGPADWGYLSGSGLLMAVNLGRLAGQSAAELVLGRRTP